MVGIIALLAGIVIIAINPGRQLAMARNTERKSDLKQINSALQQYYIDHREYPSGLTSTLTDICDTGANASSTEMTDLCIGAGLVNLSVLVPTYLTAIPKDPQASTTASAGYQIKRHSSSGKIGLSALAELEQDIVINIPEEEIVDACGVSGDATDLDCWSMISSNIMTWGPTNNVTGASSTSNGSLNTYILSSLSGIYPAADYCANLTENNLPAGTWYLPADNQLKRLKLLVYQVFILYLLGPLLKITLLLMVIMLGLLK